MAYLLISSRTSMESLDRNYVIALYDIYGVLLTDKQRAYFEDYYFMDLSISEIAENYEISRNGVHDQVKRAVLQLEEYEAKLKLYEKITKIEALDIDKPIKDKIYNVLMED